MVARRILTLLGDFVEDHEDGVLPKLDLLGGRVSTG